MLLSIGTNALRYRQTHHAFTIGVYIDNGNLIFECCLMSDIKSAEDKKPKGRHSVAVVQNPNRHFGK